VRSAGTIGMVGNCFLAISLDLLDGDLPTAVAKLETEQV
jgi:hypothetical protein